MSFYCNSFVAWKKPMSYSRKNPNKGVWGYAFLIKPLEFLCLSLYPLKFQRKWSFTPQNSAELCYTSWKFQGQRPRPMEMPHNVFFITLRNCACFSLTPGISTCSFFSNPVNSTSSTPPVWIFLEWLNTAFFNFSVLPHKNKFFWSILNR